MNRNNKHTEELETSKKFGTGELSELNSAVHLIVAVKSKGPLQVQTARQGLAHVGGTYKALLLCSTYVCESTRCARNAFGVDLAWSSELNFDINLVTADLNMSGQTTQSESEILNNHMNNSNKILPTMISQSKMFEHGFYRNNGAGIHVTGKWVTRAFHWDLTRCDAVVRPSEELMLGTRLRRGKTTKQINLNITETKCL